MARKKLGRDWGSQIKMTDNVTDRKLKILLSGEPGSGKTYFIKGAPKPFVLAAEDGTLTLHQFSIPYIRITDDMLVYEDFLTILETIRDRKKMTMADGSIVDFGLIETIALDSVWMLNARLKKEILETVNVRNAQKDLWGILLDRISDCVLKILDMDYNIIATVGEAVKADELDSDEKVVTYNFQGSFRNQIGYLFDFNLYMVKEQRGRNTIYKCYTNDENNRSAKARIGGLPKEIVDPTFEKIAAYLEEIQK